MESCDSPSEHANDKKKKISYNFSKKNLTAKDMLMFYGVSVRCTEYNTTINGNFEVGAPFTSIPTKEATTAAMVLS